MVQVKELTVADLDQVYSIAQAGLSPLWSKKEYEYFLTQPSSFCFGIWEPSGLACFVLTLLSFDEMDVVSIATRKDLQKQGMGRKLLEAVLAFPQVKRAFLEVDPTNEPAVKLYLSTGFSVQGVRKKYYQGKKDAWLMKWER